MKHSSFATAAFVTFALIVPAHAGITFGPVRGQAGQSVRLVSHSETPGGSVERTVAGKTSKGSIAVSRDRDMTWTFRAPTADGTLRGMVKVSKLSASSKIVIAGKEENNNEPSPLTGQMFAMTKAPQGEWKFQLDGSVPYTQVTREIEELTIYLKRNWYPATEVKIGDTWEFDPAWIKMIIEKDLSKAQTIGTMRLRQIRHTEQRDIAVIDVSVRSTGADFQGDGSEASASIDLTGQITVNLDTMLDTSLELTGTIKTGTSQPGSSTKVKLPIHLTVSKSFAVDGPMP